MRYAMRRKLKCCILKTAAVRQYACNAANRMTLGKNLETGEETRYDYNALYMRIKNVQILAGGILGGTFGFAGSAISQIVGGKEFDAREALGAGEIQPCGVWQGDSNRLCHGGTVQCGVLWRW